MKGPSSIREKAPAGLSNPPQGTLCRPAAWQAPAAAVLAGLLAVAAFGPSLKNDFVHQDFQLIVENPLVIEPGPWYRFWKQASVPSENLANAAYRPLTAASYRLNLVLWPSSAPEEGHPVPDPAAFHVGNLLLHVCTVIALVLAGYRLAGSAAAAGAAGALFAVHPVLTEAVVTAYGRPELMAGCFSAWLLALRVKSRRTPAEHSRFSILASQLFSGLLFLAAIMSSEHALLIWPCILLLDLSLIRDSENRRLELEVAGRPLPRLRMLAMTHLGFMLAAAAFYLLRYLTLGSFHRSGSWPGGMWNGLMTDATLLESLLTPFRLLWLAVEVFIWPGRLCPLWSSPVLSPAARLSWDVAAGMGVLLLALTGIVLLWRRRPSLTRHAIPACPGGSQETHPRVAVVPSHGPPAAALLAGLLVLLAVPTQALPMADWIFAERWLYLPAVLAAVLMALVVGRLGVLGAAGCLALALILLPSTWMYSAAYADNMTMYREVILRQPDNFHARRHLAISLHEQGEYAAAVEAANEILDRFGPVLGAYTVLLSSYLELGDGHRALQTIEAVEQLEEAPLSDLSLERRRAQELISELRRN